MRKTLIYLLTFVMISSSLLYGAGCSRTSSGPKEKKPFTFDYTTDQSNAAFFSDGETVETLLTATPFYSGRQPLPGQKTAEYDAARLKKVEEIKKEADGLVQTAVKIKPQVDALRSSFLAYLNVTLNKEPKLKGFSQEAISQLVRIKTKEQMAEVQYKSITTDNISEPYVKSFGDYLKVTKAVELGSSTLQEVNNLAAYSAIALDGLENHGSPEVKAANEKLNKDMASLDEIKEDANSLITSLEKIDYGMKQLNTGDYYLALAANDFVTTNLPELKSKTAGLTPREGLTSEDIKFIQVYLAFIEKFQNGLKSQLDAVDKAKLVAVTPEKKSFLPVAYASEEEEVQLYSNAFNALNQPLQPREKQGESIWSKGWNAMSGTIKTTFHAGQTAVGYGVDYTGTAVKNVSRLGWGLYYGNSTEDIWDDWKNNAREINKNFNNSASGSETLKTAAGYLEGAEKAAGNVGSGGAEFVMGKGYTGSAVGWMAKTTTGIFTGLGKGIFKVADRQSSTEDVITGGVDIGLSFIGGSKVVIKGSQVPGLVKGLAQEGSLVGRQGINYLATLMGRAEKKELMQLAGKEGAELVNNSATLEVVEGTLKMLGEARTQTYKEMGAILKGGGATLKQNVVQGTKESLEDLFTKKFEKNLSGLMEAFKTGAGKTPAEFLDNLIGSGLDDLIKAEAKDFVLNTGSDNSGMYRGTINWVVTIPGIGSKAFSAPVTVNVDASGKVNVSYKVSGSMPLPGGMRLVHNGSGSLTGEAKGTEIQAAGTSTGNTTISAPSLSKGYPGSAPIQMTGNINGDTINAVISAKSGGQPMAFIAKKQS